ncbi:Cerevisin [Arthrobotrys entomopaga]|nr:Cerevisin [Arthrobotrys entomopaga]
MRVPRAIQLASQPQNTTIHPKDKLEFYNILLAPNETRSWGDLFEDMGYNHTNIEEMKQTVKFRSFGSKKTFRAFGMMLAADEVEDMEKHDGVAYIQKPKVYSIPEEETYTASDVQYADYSESNVREANETMKMEAVGQHPLFQQDGESVQQDGESEQRRLPFVQFGAPYSLQRISSSRPVTPVGRGPLELRYQYTFDAMAGKGVDVYILDSGVNRHREFGRRFTRLWSAWGNFHEDDTGHGTHCAGIVGGETVGPAKNANLFSLKVMRKRPGQSGASTEGGSLTRGIEYVISRHIKQRNNPDFRVPKSGTSMATPLVAGMVADLLSRRPEFKENPGALKEYLVKTGAPNIVRDARSQAPLVNNGVHF